MSKVANNIENLDGEIWKPVKGYEGRYEVSNMGRVKSLGRYRYGKKGGTYAVKERILSNTICGAGYHRICMFMDGNRDYNLVHRLVAENFIPNTNHKDQVNHIDGDKWNNKVSNLEWVTQSENMIHSYKNGLHKKQKGSKRYCAKLNEHIVAEIKKDVKMGVKLKYLAKQHNVNPVTISDIKRGRTWRHVLPCV